ncbi:hypothetical protein TRIUR3_33075 [Triticum urartu]|uniref:non-specific serine/threonine protein kinase n=1 Tax=Triticum urartu TaxID=4572 RepID=M8AEN0_TRIUA|nr:hypothetical protein TRIUR3_33075 [Triticum urartu]
MPGWAPSRRFDQEECIEVAWNRVRLRALDPAMVDRRHAEVRLLRSLHRDHIIGFQEVWLDHDAGVLNFITEVCKSASLREHFDRHNNVFAATSSATATPAILGRDREFSRYHAKRFRGRQLELLRLIVNLVEASCYTDNLEWSIMQLLINIFGFTVIHGNWMWLSDKLQL